MNGSRQYILAAGGTGGHMIPAHALAVELMRRGHHVALVTDERGTRFPELFKDVQIHQLPAGRLTGGVKGLFQAMRNIWAGRERALTLYENFTPAAVVGFGGYPALPALLAAFKAKIPTVIHEQNAVMGRTNRFLAGRVDAIATAYHQVDRLKKRYRRKTEVTGNPVRDEVLFLRDLPYPPLSDNSIFRILVVGGSQGASILSEVVPEGLGLLPLHLRRRLQVTQQCRPEDLEKTRAQYAKLGIPADISTYMADLPQRLGWSHLVISRAGASTIAELGVAGRPAILIPYPAAMDNHQYANARELVSAGGARLIDQRRFNPFELAKQIQKMALEPSALKNAAARARQVGYPDAVEKLADLVERVGGNLPQQNSIEEDSTFEKNQEGAVA
ncbi:undecaprenyldiphospho-muramoylpentapeptide beta-N-acetylglucosaminyltransferase [Zymomonas mobilis subsp. mobilis ZM4 = ATCC 31821]|uniref:UDP-N-acetylglucosamine--N-acetylmuramyl-(pentapeptide) pyrophosphoryl-undecaprenol N-acetylglucosamine transferase n=1 Tax=Zymomonas mobilis subsp. mobilis (strain ATCC 31821 / ZM4 / CP4) TaxID=264203 RepID=MURG_ZYMMO|nr:undecaprenyldiphospho-muramoylpentapeptide beta-N-acetylglucosaminyltransferase [Zymomonas mobilis]Q9RNM6.2 RecName: Full=UDP-N-acetylglucosamine--N-acetylmuramyl-(pentapeptide) pyrophosphoryl-undecaprenol N-acetylglucosamine transferase; AltName: Full=Undecaprenyl-PP-MurNAc-pentapeptide-UDPGlcNAc GlcNAc transferase [Zymomonas mobilis subsp. mobilis ZM4 = ATCC 31821]AAV89455.1 UDP-N-acetylglucosamine--N-acetylmuramyl-(pentapeptide) pyrophosphoryl-undecaprenol N-acetylglucosamine transferase [Z